MVELESSSPEETERIAGILAAELEPDDVITVSGELGAGKTTFIRGAARALGVEGPVTSPTYTIGHLYHGRVDVSHLDLYRFDGMADAEWADLERYFENTVAFVEWPEAGAGFLPLPRATVGLRHLSERHRLIVLSSEQKDLENSVLAGAGPRV
jgi:tRNA threonylcarbamoyladenosine biosynthesis protein TsaE